MQRQRNEGLEKAASEKEKLYNEIKIENYSLANANYKLQRATEDSANERRIFETKLKNSDALLKQTLEETRGLKLASEKLEAALKVTAEQLESSKRQLDEVSVKKQQDIDMLN